MVVKKYLLSLYHKNKNMVKKYFRNKKMKKIINTQLNELRVELLGVSTKQKENSIRKKIATLKHSLKLLIHDQ